MSAATRVPYELRSSYLQGKFQPQAHFTCRCGKSLILLVKNTNNQNPTFLVKRAQERGWSCSATKPQVTCPECLQSKERHMSKTAPVLVAVEHRQPTADQRLQIRSALDKHFDDSKGRYLEGMTDEKIAEHLKVPRIFVTNIREAAYGPLLSNPEIDALREEISAQDLKIAALVNDTVAAVENIRKEMREALARLNKLEKA